MGSKFTAHPEVCPGQVDTDQPRGATKLDELDLRDTNILKGLAISAIVLHNYVHAVSPARENEFDFDPGRFALFLETVRHPSLAVQAVLSFFGHLGVPIFIFLSAYGLARSHWDDTASWTQFMAGRVRKMFPIFGLIVLPWTLVVAFEIGPHPFFRNVAPQIFFMVTGLTPLVPGLDLPPVGPWWFIPFIIEFYAIFFVIRKVTQKFGWPGLVVLSLLCLALTTLADPWLAHWNINLMETPLGRMRSVCLGIAAARYPFRVPAPLALFAGTIVVLGSGFAPLWPFTFSASVVLALWAYMELRNNLRGSRSLALIGRYSILIFLLNAIVRNQFLSFATSPMLQLLFGAISGLVSFTLAAIIQEMLFHPFLKRECECG